MKFGGNRERRKEYSNDMSSLNPKFRVTTRWNMSSQIIQCKCKLLVVISFVCCFIGCSGLDLRCTMGSSDWSYGASGKMCSVSGAVIATPNETVTTINGQTSSYWRNQDVKMFNIRSQTVNFMPKDFDKFFPGITGFQIHQSKLKVIEKHNLQPFGQLLVLYLDDNDLTTLSSDLFDHNPLLRKFYVNNNPLKSVGAKIFTKLNSLENVHFTTCNCISEIVTSKSLIPAFIERLRQKCPHLDGSKEKTKAANLLSLSATNQQEKAIQGLNEKLRAADVKTKEAEAKLLLATSQQEKAIQEMNEKLRAADEKLKAAEANLLSATNQQEKVIQGLNEKLIAADDKLKVTTTNLLSITNKCKEEIEQLNEKMKVVDDSLNTALANLFLIRNKLPVDEQLSVDLTCKVDDETCDVIDLKVEFAKSTIERVKYENLESFDKSNLRSLRISNKQTLFLPINLADHFPQLTEMSVTESGLFDIEPATFKSLDKMTELCLSQNKLMKLSAESFKDLGNLLILDLSLNRIRIMDDNTFDGLVKLEVLKLNENFLKSIDNQVFAGLDSLKELDLHDNELKFITPNIKKDHLKMSSLNLAGNECINMSFPIETQEQIEKEIIENCIAPVELKCSFEEEQIFIDEITSIGGYMCKADGFHVEYRQTTILRVSGEHAANHDVDKVKVFLALGQSITFMPMKLVSSLPKLEKIIVEKSKLTSIQRVDFEGMVGLRWMSLRYNYLAAIGEETFDDLAALEYLNLAHNKIAKLPSKAFAKLTNLVILILSNNQIVKLSADILPKKSNIEKFLVDHNQLEVIDPKIFKALRKADLIDFTSNKCVNMKHDKSIIGGKTLGDLHSEVDFSCDPDY